MQDVVIEALATLGDLRDSPRSRHPSRIERCVGLPARHLAAQRAFADELTPEAVGLLSKLALLHDIDKAVVPDRVLFNPGQLDAADAALLQGHTRAGRDTLAGAEQRLGQPSGFLHFVWQIIHSHHKRQDGRDFPGGLADKRIPLAVRIIILVDRYDGLTSRHAYQPPLAYTEAVPLIQTGAGSELDPWLMEAFVAVADAFAEVAQRYANSAKALDVEMQRLEQAVVENIKLTAPPTQCADWCAVRRKVGTSGCARRDICRIVSDPLPFTLTPRNRAAPMKTPRRLEPPIEDGLTNEIMRLLMNGKEASVYVMCCGSSLHCAKAYKEANKRSFRQAAEHQEGRKVHNGRQARAMAKDSKHGHHEQEKAWQSAKVTALFRLAGADMWVPKPYDFLDGVLLTELAANTDGDVVLRLNDATLEPNEARRRHALLIRQIVVMFCAGPIHDNPSEFNVLPDPDGLVIIDLSQTVDAASNNHAFSMLERDAGNMVAYFGRFAPKLRQIRYAKETWALYEAGGLTAETPLSGISAEAEETADMRMTLREVEAAQCEEMRRQALRQADDALHGEREEPPPPWLQ